MAEPSALHTHVHGGVARDGKERAVAVRADVQQVLRLLLAEDGEERRAVGRALRARHIECVNERDEVLARVKGAPCLLHDVVFRDAAGGAGRSLGVRRAGMRVRDPMRMRAPMRVVVRGTADAKCDEERRNDE